MGQRARMMLVVPWRRDLLGLQPPSPAGIESGRKVRAIHFLGLNVPISSLHLNLWTSVTSVPESHPTHKNGRSELWGITHSAPTYAACKAGLRENHWQRAGGGEASGAPTQATGDWRETDSLLLDVSRTPRPASRKKWHLFSNQ